MRNFTLLILMVVGLTACQSAYYSAMEKVGIHKREILVDRVEEARESQQEAQQQFKSALQQFSELIKFEGGSLQKQYDDTSAEYEASKKAAEEVTERINAIESVAAALFKEWEAELDQFTNARLKQDSREKLVKTKRQYTRLIQTMREAEESMAPVLASLNDNTLYLKHNLNAKAIGALQDEFGIIERDISRLIKNMNQAIAQSEQFISLLKQ